MSQRLEAAARALWEQNHDLPYEAMQEGHARPYRREAEAALEAADKVMFSAERMALVTIELANEWTSSPAIRARMIANIFKGKPAA